MKSKQRLSKLIEQFLKTSPRSTAQKRNSILPPEHRQPLNRLPTDQQYIKNFIVHVDCSYMYNYYGPLTVNEQKMYLHKKSFVNPLSAGLVRRKAIQINDQSVDKKQMLFELIKLLNKDKLTVLRYVQMQQYLSSLTVDHIRSYKKVIVFLYKWVLTQKHTFTPNSIHYQLCHDLSTLIIKRIYESHENGDYQLMKNTEEELLTIENLQKARQLKKSGKQEQAKQFYQTVYFGRVVDENDRQQALQYIRERCRQQRDTTTLQRMIKRINQGQGIKIHQKSLTRTISEIQQLLQNSKSQQFIVESLLLNPNNNKMYNQAATNGGMNPTGDNNPGRRILGRRVSGSGKYFDGNGNGNNNSNSSASTIIREEECEDL